MLRIMARVMVIRASVKLPGSFIYITSTTRQEGRPKQNQKQEQDKEQHNESTFENNTNPNIIINDFVDWKKGIGACCCHHLIQLIMPKYCR